MFSGIIQAVQPILSIEKLSSGARVQIPRPNSFMSLKPGASIAVDGVCLTLENDSPETMQFFIGAETDGLLKWSERYYVGKKVNLEPSLRLGDPVDGHFVTGHVDSLGVLKRREMAGESLFIDIEVSSGLEKLIWHKGSLAINGVSLTINEIRGSLVSFCLIPETQKRTNLGELSVGDRVHIEPDVLARIVQRQVGDQFLGAK